MSVNYQFLTSVARRSDFHQLLLEKLGGYRGAYSLGVTRSPDRKNGFALLLSVEGRKPKKCLQAVSFEGRRIPVIVCGAFRPPDLQGDD